MRFLPHLYQERLERGKGAVSEPLMHAKLGGNVRVGECE